jgi:radical SAM superfamily enzyme YgiQ (UPF0313 family)
MADKGVKIVLTASATEMSDFANNQFVAFVGGFAKGPVPLWLCRKALYPPAGQDEDGRAKYAPYGLRKIEALLLESGFNESEVAVVHPSNLDAFVGPETKAIGISSMDPTGMAYVSKTYSSLVGGGEPLNAIEFRELMAHLSLRKHGARIIVGGFGSWQLERKKVSDAYGIDCVVIGEGEKIATEIFRKAVNGEPLPRVVRLERDQQSDVVPLIRHPAMHGCVEITRGCGRNCQFCTPTMQRKRDIPLENIMKEVETTVREGSSGITLVTEDLFLYGMKDKRFVPNKEAVVRLVETIAKHPGVESIQPSHSSLAPVVADRQMVKEVAEILLEKNWYKHESKPIVTSEVGMETGSVRLMKKYMAGKTLPYTPDEWPEVAAQSLGIMNDNDWYPLATLIIGLPEEKEEDVIATLEMVDDLKKHYLFYVPLFFVPLENCTLMDKAGAELNSLTKQRWELLVRCWEHNVREWGNSFLEHRIPNQFIYRLVKQAVIPVAAKTAGFYYELKRRRMMKDAILRMAEAAA